MVELEEGGSVIVMCGKFSSKGKTKMVEVLNRFSPDTSSWVGKDVFDWRSS